MAVALTLGAIIGSERQFRGRMAGLRTNALVALGAAAFVTFAALFPDDINPTRVAAQIVSGIGFLGAGIIFRDGFNIQGINTAATLWCAAAVGMIAGTGHILYAVALTSLIVFANLGLRPIVRRLKAASARSYDSEQYFDLTFECRPDDEKEFRAILMATLTEESLKLCRIASRKGSDAIKIGAKVSGTDDAETRVERVITRISRDSALLLAAWSIAEDAESDFE
ncbi:MgtC/SapB family protein [Sulfitobacter sp. F26169L]|uniref:MgtC/SapB family protein n=1 Tax=Sulfitobacter sp. F26169L TaxID=2996015 RepID=UPI002260F2E6|nr:MgtC/SapB family protein [Sulfitobacter sp. F26169L]MCX7566057.1 MgtC/SapB family protein [Sulfitobacter sp. F26169L]